MEKPQGSLEKLYLWSSLGLRPRELHRDSFSRLHPWLFNSLSQTVGGHQGSSKAPLGQSLVFLVLLIKNFLLLLCRPQEIHLENHLLSLLSIQTDLRMQLDPTGFSLENIFYSPKL